MTYVWRGVVIFLLLFLAGCTTSSEETPSAELQATIYKSPTCGCCVSYTAYLENEGWNIETITTNNMASIKQQYSIPRNMESCHTMMVEGYFVEGHVPMEAIDKLLTERPDIDGIALPAMPAGSPGMPGVQTDPWVIYALKDGQVSEFMIMEG